MISIATNALLPRGECKQEKSLKITHFLSPSLTTRERDLFVFSSFLIKSMAKPFHKFPLKVRGI